MTVNDELLEAGVLAVNFMKTDLGSGVKEIDLLQILSGKILNYLHWLLLINCYFLDGNEVPVVTGSRDNIAILPLSQGSHFILFSSPVDNVGNRKPLERAMQDLVEIHFPIVVIPCPNNCSNNGNCTAFGDCVCEDGYYGSNCSEGI